MSGPDGQTDQPASTAGMLGRLGRQSAAYLAADAFSKGLALVLLPLYLQHLSPVDFGIVALAGTVVVLMAILLGFALQGSMQRIYFELETDAERSQMYGTLLVFLLLVPGLIVLGLELLGSVGGLELFPSAPYDPYLRLAILTAWFNVFREIPVGIYTVREQAGRAAALLAANAALTAALTIWLVVFEDRGALGALEAMFLGSGVVAAVSVALTVRESTWALSPSMLRGNLAIGLLLIPHLVGHWVLALADRAILDRYESAASVGRFALAANLASGLMLVATGSGRAFTPRMTREMKSAGGGAGVPVLGTWWVAALTFVALALALLGDPLILLLFDESYAGATELVPWLAAGYLAFGLYLVLSQGTWFSMRMGMVPLITLAAGAINVGVALILVPEIGAVGAAISTLAGFVALALLQGILSNRLHPIGWELWRWAKLLITAGVCFAAAQPFGAGGEASAVIARIIATFVLFPALLWAGGFLTARERGYLAACLSGARARF